MRKIPISGGPHSGKTTLLEALRIELPDAYFVPEPAETVIARELSKQIDDPDYTPVVPWDDYKKFAHAVTDESELLEANIPDNSDVVFLDRSIIDTIGYAQLNEYNSFVPEVRRRAKLARYAFALFCEPVGQYTITDIRRETAELAKLTHRFLAEAYSEFGIPVVHLPAIPVEERVGIVKASLTMF